MRHFTYLVGILTPAKKDTIVTNITNHFIEGGYDHATVNIKNGGQVYVRMEDGLFFMNTSWRGSLYENEYYSLEAALHDGLEFATDYADFSRNPGPYPSVDKVDKLRINLSEFFGLDCE